MTKNLTKLLFLSSLMMGSLISISSNSWFGVWMGLEMNLLSFIPLMVNEKNLMINESSIKYFIVQAMASTMLLFSILMILMKLPMNWEKNNEIIMMMIISSLLMKIGAAPFHFWLPEVMKTSKWSNCFMLMTWQKAAPLMVMSYCIEMSIFISSIVILSITMGAMGGLNQTSLRQLMAYSSISHIGWMVGSMMANENAWEMYFMIYSILSLILIMLFNQSNLYFINQLFMSNPSNKEIKFIMMTSLLSLGGLPPLLGFLPKWIVMQIMIENKMTSMIMTMVMITTITIYYYMRMSFSALILTNSETLWSIDVKSKKFKMLTPAALMLSSMGLILTSLTFNF